MTSTLPGISRKDVRDLAREMMGQGWVFDRMVSGSHTRWVWPPSGDTVNLPSSPSDSRWEANTRAQIARTMGVRREPKPSPKPQVLGRSQRQADEERARHLERKRAAATAEMRDRSCDWELERRRIQARIATLRGHVRRVEGQLIPRMMSVPAEKFYLVVELQELLAARHREIAELQSRLRPV
ncbi:MAG: hypothetical protein NVSMB4_07370 [Acidimicrobiales bacterium]